MASIIRIKRSSVSGNPGTLGAGELAYSNLADNGSNGGDRLYIGMGIENNGNAANHVVIGGKFFTDRLDHTAGLLTANSALVVDGDKKLDELLVDNLSLNGSTLSSTDSNGNILITPNGTGKTVVSNLYIGDSSTSLTEFIQDITGGQIIGGVGLTTTFNDNDGTTTIDLDNTAVTPGSYGSSSAIPTFTVDAQGRLTAAGEESIATSLALSGDSGNDSVNLLTDTLSFLGGTGLTSTVGTNTVTFNLDNTTVTAGSYGSATSIPTFTVDAQGRITVAGSEDVATSLSITADSGNDTVNLLTDTLSFTGGTGVSTSVTNNQLTISIGQSVGTGDSVTFGSVSVSGSASVGSSLTISGDLSINTNKFTVDSTTGNTYTAGTLESGGDLTVGGNTSLSGTLDVTGNSTIGGSLDVAGADFTVNTDKFTVDGPTGDTAVSGTLDVTGAATFNGGLDAGSNTITNIADPVNPTDAANKQYVDAARSGLDVKQSVRAASTGNLSLTGVQTVDGVSLVAGDRVLAKNQSTASQNGVYVVASGAWSRASDFDEPYEVTAGVFFFVEEGTVNGDAGFVITSDNPQTVGTDALSFTQFSGAGQLVAGDALTKTGNLIDVNVAANGGIEIQNDALQLKSTLAGDGLTYSSGVLTIGGTADRITVTSDAIDIASTYIGQTSITTLGVIGTGTWQADVINPTYGGTGVNNGSKTITLGGNLTTSGNYNTTLTVTGSTNVTLPTTGTLATLDGFETLSNKEIDSSNIGASVRGTAAFTTLTANNAVTFTNGTDTSSTSSGALVVSGGVGVGKTISVGGDVVGAGADVSTLSGFNIDGGTY